jgi:hypothetical protein
VRDCVASETWFGEDPTLHETESGEPVIGHIGRRQIQRMAEYEIMVHLEVLLRRRTMLELTMVARHCIQIRDCEKPPRSFSVEM